MDLNKYVITLLRTPDNDSNLFPYIITIWPMYTVETGCTHSIINLVCCRD